MTVPDGALGAFAARVAPVVDACVIGVHRTIDPAEMEAVREQHGYRIGLGVLLELRLPLLAGPVPAESFRAVFRWLGDADRLVAEQVDGGWLAVIGDGHGAVSLTERGRVLLLDVVARYDGLLQRRWGSGPVSLDAVLAALHAVVAAAVPVPGGAFAAWQHRPQSEPGGTAMQVWHRLVALRYQRADAHAEAAAPGGDAGEVERRTNTLAAPPWGAIGADERRTLLHDLERLVLT